MRGMNDNNADDDALFAQTADRLNMTEHCRAFAAYAREFRTGDAEHDEHFVLKEEHSRNVFRHACGIAEGTDVFLSSPVLARALLSAGLYHDLGRFPQYARYKTFSDPLSINHAELSAAECKRRDFLAKEAPRVRGLALAGVVMHNRFALPAGADENALAVAKAVRDADKLDIMRVMAAHLVGTAPVDAVVVLNVERSPRVSPPILRAVLERRLGSYADLKTTTDFALLICGWVYDLNFHWSRKKAAASGHLFSLFASLPQTEELEPFFAQYKEDMAQYVD